MDIKEIIGVSPKSNIGKYLDGDEWSYRPLLDMCREVAPEVALPWDFWDDEVVGPGITDAQASALAEALEVGLANGRVADFINQFSSEGDYGTPFYLIPFREDVVALIMFLKECGGFEVHFWWEQPVKKLPGSCH